MILTLKQLSDSQRSSDAPAIALSQASSQDLLQQLELWVTRGWLRAWIVQWPRSSWSRTPKRRQVSCWRLR